MTGIITSARRTWLVAAIVCALTACAGSAPDDVVEDGSPTSAGDRTSASATASAGDTASASPSEDNTGPTTTATASTPGAAAGLLSTDDLRQQLDQRGWVAVNIQFAVGSADIVPESRPQIEQVLWLLLTNPSLTLSIEGHTDNTGDPARNRALSQARAQSVVAALTAEGIAADRLTAVGYGADRPVADNGTEQGRAQNRRVELVKR